MRTVLIWHRVNVQGELDSRVELYDIENISSEEGDLLLAANGAMINSITENNAVVKVRKAINPDAQGGPWAGRWMDARVYVTMDLPIEGPIDCVVSAGIFEGEQ